MTTECNLCFRPEATKHQWETIPEGKGSHLCWGAGANCEDKRDERIAKQAREIERLRALINCEALEQAEGAIKRLKATIERLTRELRDMERAEANARSRGEALLDALDTNPQPKDTH